MCLGYSSIKGSDSESSREGGVQLQRELKEDLDQAPHPPGQVKGAVSVGGRRIKQFSGINVYE